MTHCEIVTSKARAIRSKPCSWCWPIKDSLMHPNSNRFAATNRTLSAIRLARLPGVEQNTGALGHGSAHLRGHRDGRENGRSRLSRFHVVGRRRISRRLKLGSGDVRGASPTRQPDRNRRLQHAADHRTNARRLRQLADRRQIRCVRLDGPKCRRPRF